MATVAVSALVSGDAPLGSDAPIERPEQPDTEEPLPEPDPLDDPAPDGEDAAEEVSPGLQVVTIRVLGDEVDFRGAIRGAEGTRYVGGVAPARYRVPVTEDTQAIRASFQKQGDPGTMTVQIVADGEVVAEDEVVPSLGRTSLTWEPGQ